MPFTCPCLGVTLSCFPCVPPNPIPNHTTMVFRYVQLRIKVCCLQQPVRSKQRFKQRVTWASSTSVMSHCPAQLLAISYRVWYVCHKSKPGESQLYIYIQVSSLTRTHISFPFIFLPSPSHIYIYYIYIYRWMDEWIDR